MARVSGRSVALAAAVCTVAGAVELVAQVSGATPRDAERAIADQSGTVGTGRAVAAALHPRGVLVWPGAPVAVGAEAARLLVGLPALDSVSLALQPLALELSADSSLAASWGLAIATRRAVGLKPASPHNAAGMRTEPPVSEPIAATAMPSVTGTAAPDEEPPGMRPVARSQGLRGVP